MDTATKYNLTARQYELLKIVRETCNAQGYAPSGDELADAMRISVQGVFCKIAALTEKGYLTRTVGVHRSMRLTDAAREAMASYEASAPAAKV